MATQVVDDEDEMDLNEWTPVGSGRGRGKANARQEKEVRANWYASQGNKRELEEYSSDEEPGLFAKRWTGRNLG